MKTPELAGYTKTENADGSITFTPIKKKPVRAQRCGDVRINKGGIYVSNADQWIFSTLKGVWIDKPVGAYDYPLFCNLLDLAAAFPEGIHDPSELVRKSDVVAALQNARSENTGFNIFEQSANYTRTGGCGSAVQLAVDALRDLGIVTQ